MNLRQLPIQILRSGFDVARLPIALVGDRLNSEGGAQQWRPYLLFESIEAASKSAAGRLIGDSDLEKEGRTIRARVAKERQSNILDLIARQRTRITQDKQIDLRTEEERQRQIEETVNELAHVGAEMRAQQLDEQDLKAANAKKRAANAAAAPKKEATR